jgi:hypothetical protein
MRFDCWMRERQLYPQLWIQTKIFVLLMCRERIVFLLFAVGFIWRHTTSMGKRLFIEVNEILFGTEAPWCSQFRRFVSCSFVLPESQKLQVGNRGQPLTILFSLLVKLSLCLHHEDVWGSGCIDPRFLNLATNWKWVVSITHQSLYPREKSPRTHRIGVWVVSAEWDLPVNGNIFFGTCLLKVLLAPLQRKVAKNAPLSVAVVCLPVRPSFGV